MAAIINAQPQKRGGNPLRRTAWSRAQSAHEILTISPTITTRMRTHTTRIPIAAAAEVAARLPYPHAIAGGWYRTSTAICHGGDNKSALSFCDSEHPGDSPLRVYCHSHNCDATAIRHALQQVTGLWACICADCRTAFRAGQPPPGANATTLHAARSAQNGPRRTDRHFAPQNPQNGVQSRSGPGQGRDTNAYAAELWTAAQPSTAGPAPNHPVALWLLERGLWPAGEPLPRSSALACPQPSQVPPAAYPTAPRPARC